MKSIRKILEKKSLQKEFKKSFETFSKLSDPQRGFEINWNERMEILSENKDHTSYDRQYFLHTAWAARKLQEIKPSLHIDVSSYVYFAGIVSAFVKTEYYEYRPIDAKIEGFEAKKGDLLHLPFSDNSVESLSCMHVIEHV